MQDKPTNIVDNQQDQNDDDAPDEWDQRIIDTGCDKENLQLTECYADAKDWRECIPEMKAFKECWDFHKNNIRVSTEESEDAQRPM